MDPRHTGEILKHLEKQNELLMEAYNSMSHELHKLQVEEEMLMRKFYELMTAQGLTKKNEKNTNVSNGDQVRDDSVLLTNNTGGNSYGGKSEQSSAIVPVNDNEQH
ncbi:uncharacterized protein LOC110629514 isoform X1 [Manihot esculenta]|uniref:Uncharacterized protein n=1 Tax=Manihot esculenta TaxID=3983 RepID=A0A2C9US21_MANES|nr:uncharacterized protein LOC110629514 isoform X1 [Manihot esculenta]OAY33641.1 hypothetical protein MANES_13G112700v8 [Manihot esculenta]